MAEFNRLEHDYRSSSVEHIEVGKVVCSFETRHGGTFFIECKDGEIKQRSGEKPLHMLPEDEQEYIKRATVAAYMLTFCGKHHRNL